MGVARKLLLLPVGIASRISESEMQSVIAHEFAHMRRNDFLKNLFYEQMSLPVSYHPILWLTRAKIAESREIVCDRMAADFTGRSQYSRSLLRLAAGLTISRPSYVLYPCHDAQRPIGGPHYAQRGGQPAAHA